MTSEHISDPKRHAMLGRLRAQLGRTVGQAPDPHPVKKHIKPKQARVGGAARVATFLKRAQAVDATTVRVTDGTAAVAEIARYVAAGGETETVTCATSPLIQNLPWQTTNGLKMETGPLDRARADRAISVTGAVCGITETGAIMTASGPDHPVTLNFLPVAHIVVLTADQVVSSYEQAWEAYDTFKGEAAKGEIAWPRAVHWITGPSRSADIALKPELGAHGPLRLHVIVIDQTS